MEVCKAQGLTPNSYNTLYNNLQTLYIQHNYNLDHIWNSSETRIHASTQSRARVLAKKGSNTVYSTIPKFQEWLTMNYAINAARGVLFSFNIFRSKRLRDDYIKFYKPSTCMAMQKKA